MNDFDELLNALRAHIEAQLASIGQVRIGIVTGYDGASHTASVAVQPEGNVFKDLPVATMAAGNGWSVTAAPAIGAQVVVLPTEGDTAHGIVIGSVNSQAAPPPQTFTDPNASGAVTPLQAGEAIMSHASGTFWRMTADGFVGNGNFGIRGTLTADAIYDATGSLAELRSHYTSHVHPLIQPGTANSQPPLAADQDNSGTDTPEVDPFQA